MQIVEGEFPHHDNNYISSFELLGFDTIKKKFSFQLYMWMFFGSNCHIDCIIIRSMMLGNIESFGIL